MGSDQSEIDFFRSSKPRVIYESCDDDDFEVKSHQQFKTKYKYQRIFKDSQDGLSYVKNEDKFSAGDLDILSILNKSRELIQIEEELEDEDDGQFSYGK